MTVDRRILNDTPYTDCILFWRRVYRVVPCLEDRNDAGYRVGGGGYLIRCQKDWRVIITVRQVVEDIPMDITGNAYTVVVEWVLGGSRKRGMTST